jgi:hypothetical protein
MQSKFESKVTGVEWVGADDLVRAVLFVLSAHSAVVCVCFARLATPYTALAAKRHGMLAIAHSGSSSRCTHTRPFPSAMRAALRAAKDAAPQPTTPTATNNDNRPTNTERLRRHAAEPHLALQGRRLQL